MANENRATLTIQEEFAQKIKAENRKEKIIRWAPVLVLVALILFCYHRAAFAAGMGKQRQLLITGLLAVLLCGAANYRAHIPALYAGGLFWAAAELWYPGLPPVKDEVDTHDPA